MRNDIYGESFLMRKKQSGHTLIEVLFATFLVGMSGTVLLSSSPTATATRMKAESLNRASGLVQKEMESIRGLGYANLTASQLNTFGLIDSTTEVSSNTYAFTNSDSANGDSVANVLRNGTGTVTIERADIELKRVTVTVNWWDGRTTRTFTASALIANL